MAVTMACAKCLNEAATREIQAAGNKNFNMSVVSSEEFKIVSYDSHEKMWEVPAAFTVENGTALCLGHFMENRLAERL